MTEILIYGEIGGDIVSSSVVSELKGLDTDELTVRVNSPGGDVYEGLAIMNALRSHPATVTAVVEGLAASAASFIAVGGADRVVMRPTAELMVHEAMSFIGGNAADMSRVVADLDRISANLSTVYAERAGGDPAEWRERMRAETWFSAEEAVAVGLADAVEDGRAAVAAVSGRVTNHFKYGGRSVAPSPTLTALSGQKEEDGGMSSLSHEDVVNIVREVMNENVTVTSDVEVTYPEGSTVVPTGKVVIEPQGELPPSGLSFAVGEAADGFVAEVDEETGVLTVTAPSGAEPDTEVALTVTVSGNDSPVELPVTVAVKAASSDEEEAPDEEPAPSEAPALDDRVVLDVDTYNDLKAAAKLGWDAKDKADTASREAEVDQWIKDGRFNVATRSKAVALAHKDMDAARALYGSIPKNTIPVAEIGHGKDVDAAQDAAKSDFRARADRLLGTRSNF
ncbi:MAG: ATP-dependent Clp protease proteolytic subunit [Corynebacterium sp.]|nr:ATP-dependent Clp protease proteolytic subunit [Corynebacterium sp.]